MTDSDVRAIEGLMTDFAWHADRGQGEELAALFMPDAMLVVGGRAFQGREQIAADCNERASQVGRKVRHLWSNLKVLGTGQADARTAAVMLTFEQTPQQPGTQLRISDVEDHVVKGSDEKWRFANRTIARAMTVHE